MHPISSHHRVYPDEPISQFIKDRTVVCDFHGSTYRKTVSHEDHPTTRDFSSFNAPWDISHHPKSQYLRNCEDISKIFFRNKNELHELCTKSRTNLTLLNTHQPYGVTKAKQCSSSTYVLSPCGATKKNLLLLTYIKNNMYLHDHLSLLQSRAVPALHRCKHAPSLLELDLDLLPSQIYHQKTRPAETPQRPHWIIFPPMS